MFVPSLDVLRVFFLHLTSLSLYPVHASQNWIIRKIKSSSDKFFFITSMAPSCLSFIQPVQSGSSVCHLLFINFQLQFNKVYLFVCKDSRIEVFWCLEVFGIFKSSISCFGIQVLNLFSFWTNKQETWFYQIVIFSCRDEVFGRLFGEQIFKITFIQPFPQVLVICAGRMSKKNF